MAAERAELCQHVPLPGYPIPVGNLPFLVDDDIPEDEEIAWVVRRLCLNLLGSSSGMQAEHLCQWLISETRKDLPDATNWQKVVAIVQATFCEEVLFV